MTIRACPRAHAPMSARHAGRLLPLAVALATLAIPASRASALDFAVGGEGGYFGMSNASSSAKAIFDGSSGGATYGGFLHLGLGQMLFVEAHGRVFQKTGERVFVANSGGPVFRLGHPLKIRTVPVYAEVGLRFLRSSRFAPYVAAGAGATSYREESNVAGLVETDSRTKFSGHLAFGMDFLTGPVRIGVEAGWSTVPKTIGESGVSKVYGETDVGGFTVLGRLGFGSAP